MGPIAIALVLVGVAAFLLALDLLVPSGGVLLVLALISCVGSILFAFRHSYEAGVWMLIAELACVPLGAWLFLKLWPNTPLGRRMIIEPADAKPYTWEADSLVGKTGVTLCDLVPAGEVEIESRRWKATSRSGLIAQGTSVKIVAEEMGQLFVVPNASASKSAKAATPKGSSLDRPADDLGIDSL
jgi:membrane-bound ClpP family serine protease